jgi:ubiquinone/menaquinone biosynthesis C-methylase UbiE
MPKGTLDYHRQELSIATNPQDPRRILPDVSSRHHRILDVGCGAGQTLIGSKLPETVLAVGVDLDREALTYGQQQSTDILFICAQGEALPFAANSFDLVICRVALPYMHVKVALSEIARVLDKGGDLWLVLHPFSMTVRELSDNIRRRQLKAAVYRLWVLLNGFSLHALDKQWQWLLHSRRYESWQSTARTKRILLSAGFENVSVKLADHFVVTARKK